MALGCSGITPNYTKASKNTQFSAVIWCPEEDSNFHDLAATGT
ncbi:zinc finger and BTB domain-containing protein 11 [Acetobacter orientalis]|uniref:Zinc finger and BTB domain-containing protein 11 n=1 Tax=Acetobacter orientalis TaxID=146474 RepID=A0A2Z5ZL02_9PROT|nr:zinc finger and BTB domain-containing protein 11 [Acetobacter orientalis]